jgi:hypothetical protein
MLQIVNGYPCQDCADVALAKQGKNPAHPNTAPTKPGQPDKPGQGANLTSGAAASPAVALGGSLAAPNGATTQAQSAQASTATLYSGALVNLSV